MASSPGEYRLQCTSHTTVGLTVRQCIQHAVWGPGMAFWMLLEITFGIGCPQGQRFIIIFPIIFPMKKIAVWGHITSQTHPDFAMVDLLNIWLEITESFHMLAGALFPASCWRNSGDGSVGAGLAGRKWSVFGEGVTGYPPIPQEGFLPGLKLDVFRTDGTSNIKNPS